MQSKPRRKQRKAERRKEKRKDDLRRERRNTKRRERRRRNRLPAGANERQRARTKRRRRRNRGKKRKRKRRRRRGVNARSGMRRRSLEETVIASKNRGRKRRRSSKAVMLNHQQLAIAIEDHLRSPWFDPFPVGALNEHICDVYVWDKLCQCISQVTVHETNTRINCG